MSYDPTGAQGPTGATGATGASGTTFSYIGTWIDGSYAVNTLAVDSLDNNTYVCIVQTDDVINDPPSTVPAYWTLFVNGGATGVTGTFDLAVDANSVLFSADGTTPTFDSDFTYENNTLSSPNVTISDTLGTYRLRDSSSNLGTSGQVLTSITYEVDDTQVVSWQNLPTLPTAQGITGSIQFNDGSGGFTGSSGFLWTETGGMGNAYRLTGGLNGNYIDLDADQFMTISIGGDVEGMGKGVLINASSASINLTDRTDPELTDSQISINSDELAITVGGTNGITGQYLGSNGAGKVVWLTPQVYQATYYKNSDQNLTSPTTDVTFDEDGTWNNTGGYITHEGGTTDFTVGITGLYQLEFNANIIAVGTGSSWTSLNKTISVDITRSPEAEVFAIQQSASISSGANYSQSLSCTFRLLPNDVINCRISNNFTAGVTGPPYARGLTNTFDLNTFFTWRFIS